jgi:hypothetical protein
VYRNPNRATAPVPGIYAGRVHWANVGPGHWRTKITQTIRPFEATTIKRANGGGGPRPFTGRMCEEAQGFATPEMILDGAASKAKTKREDRLIDLARRMAEMDARNREAIRPLVAMEADALSGLSDRAASIAEDVREAVGL